MTKVEMIEKLRYKARNIKARLEPSFFTEVADALEQEPDAISRRGLIERIEQIKENYKAGITDMPPDISDVLTAIRYMPSVRPRIGTGHWKYLGCGNYECSRCRHIHKDLSGQKDNMNYCPNCGVEMCKEENEG